MSVDIIFEFNVAPENVENLKSFFRDKLPVTRKYDGCISLNVLQNQENPTSFVIEETWESREHFEKYLGWRQETGVLGEFVGLHTEPFACRYFDRTDL